MNLKYRQEEKIRDALIDSVKQLVKFGDALNLLTSGEIWGRP